VTLGDVVQQDPVLICQRSLPTYSPATVSDPQVPILWSIANCHADQWQWGSGAVRRGGKRGKEGASGQHEKPA